MSDTSKIKLARKAAHLTLRQAAETLGLHLTELARIECGLSEPSAELTRRMHDLYELQSDDTHFAELIYSDQELTETDRVHIETLRRKHG